MYMWGGEEEEEEEAEAAEEEEKVQGVHAGAPPAERWPCRACAAVTGKGGHARESGRQAADWRSAPCLDPHAGPAGTAVHARGGRGKEARHKGRSVCGQTHLVFELFDAVFRHGWVCVVVGRGQGRERARCGVISRGASTRIRCCRSAGRGQDVSSSRAMRIEPAA